jgi:hypothetical protein
LKNGLTETKNKFGNTVKMAIFVTSITSNIRRGRKMLAPQKAGIFRFQKELAIYTCRAVAVMATASRAERLVIDSGKGKSPFCLPAINVSHHAHRDQIPRRSADIPRTPDHTGQVAQTGCGNNAPTTGVAHRIYSTKAGGKRAGKTPIIVCNSVF